NIRHASSSISRTSLRIRGRRSRPLSERSSRSRPARTSAVQLTGTCGGSSASTRRSRSASIRTATSTRRTRTSSRFRWARTGTGARLRTTGACAAPRAGMKIRTAAALTVAALALVVLVVALARPLPSRTPTDTTPSPVPSPSTSPAQSVASQPSPTAASPGAATIEATAARVPDEFHYAVAGTGAARGGVATFRVLLLDLDAAVVPTVGGATRAIEVASVSVPVPPGSQSAPAVTVSSSADGRRVIVTATHPELRQTIFALDVAAGMAHQLFDG